MIDQSKTRGHLINKNDDYIEKHIRRTVFNYKMGIGLWNKVAIVVMLIIDAGLALVIITLFMKQRQL